jgi:hypothetical protein
VPYFPGICYKSSLQKMSNNHEFCENRHSDSDICLRDLNDFLEVFSNCFSNFDLNFVILYTHVVSLSKHNKTQELVNVN